jgi:trimethylamine:corrinoid methyltransferase-like protein
MGERALDKVENILPTHKAEPMDEALAKEIDNIVESAKMQLQ